MEITINLTGLDNLAVSISELAAALRAGAKADDVIQTASRTAKAKAPKPKPSEAPAAEAAAESVLDEPTQAPTEAPPAGLTLDDAKAGLVTAIKLRGNAGAKELMASFGATRISEVKPADYAAFIAVANTKVE